MVICNICGENNENIDMEVYCPYCDRFIADEVWRCTGCGSLIDYAGDEWECPECSNTGIVEADNVIFQEECPQCGAVMNGGCCEECGYPDVNQGWLGENY